MSIPQMPSPPPAPSSGGPKKRARIPWYAIVIVVVGVALIAGTVYEVTRPGTGGPAATATAVSPSVSTVAGAAALKAKPGAFQVRLFWKHADGDAPETFRIFRNGDMVGQVGGSDRSYLDTSAAPETRYTYTVDGIAQDGSLSPKAVVHTKTTGAPLGMARLQGVFNIKLHITSSSGVSGMNDNTTAGWRFTPDCSGGPCATAFRDIHWAQMQADLKQDGASYSGDFTVSGALTCQGTNTTSSMHLSVHVTDARTLKDEWRATKIEGTMTLSDAAQFGCSTASITYSVAGALPV